MKKFGLKFFCGQVLINCCMAICIMAIVTNLVMGLLTNLAQNRTIDIINAVNMQQNEMIHSINIVNSQQNKMIRWQAIRIEEERELRIMMDQGLQAQINSKDSTGNTK